MPSSVDLAWLAGVVRRSTASSWLRSFAAEPSRLVRWAHGVRAPRALRGATKGLVALGVCALGALAFTPHSASAQGTRLTIEIDNVRPGAAVFLALFDTRGAWLEDALAVRRNVLWSEEGETSVRWELDELPIAVYAARAYQDLDGDGELDKNRIGLPSEPFGFSNDAKPRLGPPGWRRAKFELPVSSVLVRFALRGGWKKAEEIAKAFERKFGKVTDAGTSTGDGKGDVLPQEPQAQANEAQDADLSDPSGSSGPTDPDGL